VGDREYGGRLASCDWSISGTAARRYAAWLLHPQELRVQHAGRPYRILFAFDPRRNAYLILGGDKTGKPNWYEDAIRRAEAIYKRHVKEIGG